MDVLVLRLELLEVRMATNAEAKHLIIGTAGHVDHGKTTLIKAMTGVNTDRLKEEQERGLTIDLGFASLQLPSGRQVGIVDVPGHEKFLKNMLAGASGVDIALLVVAADEGVMPQTREHMEILDLLEIRHGVVALTKCDMVERDWLEIVEEDLREYLSGTFLKNARIIPVSGVTGDGIGELTHEIDKLAAAVQQRSVEGPFRLPIDRAFSMTGFGTVVTGTLVSGTVRIGDTVRILPEGLESRVRQIQVHGRKHEAASAGNRVAVNVAGLEVADIQRGDVLVPPGYLAPTNVIDVSVAVLPNSPRPLKNRTRIRLHIGTAEAIGRSMILGESEIEPGARGFAQIRLEKAIVAARGDRFVIRFYSPARVMGGGIVLDPVVTRHRLNDSAVIERLQRKLRGDPADIVEDALSINDAGLTRDEIAKTTGLTPQEMENALLELASSDRILELKPKYLSKLAYDNLLARMKQILQNYHRANPMRTGMPKEELRRQIGPNMDAKSYQAILSSLAAAGLISASETAIWLPNHRPILTDNQQRLAESILTEYINAGVNPPTIADVEQRFGPSAKEIISLLIERSDLIRIQPDLLFSSKAIDNAEAALREFFAKNERMTVSQFRDIISSSRRYVVPLLEYFDSRRITCRAGDMRTLWK